MRTKSVYVTFFLVWLILLIGSFIAGGFFVQTFWLRVFFATNLATFLLYGIDKIEAQIKRRRVPERILYTAAFLGGPIGALLAMHLFRHKTRKFGFQFILGILLLLQVLIALSIFKRLGILPDAFSSAPINKASRTF